MFKAKLSSKTISMKVSQKSYIFFTNKEEEKGKETIFGNEIISLFQSCLELHELEHLSLPFYFTFQHQQKFISHRLVSSFLLCGKHNSGMSVLSQTV